MKRTMPFVLMLALAAYGYACKSGSSDTDDGDGTGTTPPGEQPGTERSTEDWQKVNPLEGIAPAKAVLETGAFSDGPVWHTGLGVLFFSTPYGEGALYRMLPDGRVIKVRDGVRALGTTPIGNTVAANGDLITVEAKRVVRVTIGEKGVPSEPIVIATGYEGGGNNPPPPPPDPDGGVTAPPPSAPGTFDTLNDVTVAKNGTMYVTDPGYWVEPYPVANRIYRITPDGVVEVVEAFEDVPRPNGIALDREGKHLYVGFTTPIMGTMPFIRQYIVNEDGTLGEWVKFVDIGPEDSAPDGIAIDLANNVYVATKTGIQVFKEDGSKIGDIPVPEQPTGMTFGGKDMKSLYVTTHGTKLWEVKVNVPGIAQ